VYGAFVFCLVCVRSMCGVFGLCFFVCGMYCLCFVLCVWCVYVVCVVCVVCISGLCGVCFVFFDVCFLNTPNFPTFSITIDYYFMDCLQITC